jgi:coproporphyrinogen III oxidase
MHTLNGGFALAIASFAKTRLLPAMVQVPVSFDDAALWFRDLQQRICAGLKTLDGHGHFIEDAWEREGGGGGFTQVFTNGALFERAGVNYSKVFGTMEEGFSQQLPGNGHDFKAAGVSLVLHPKNPMIPTVHANVRMIQKGDAAWFGGGMDLTPCYPYVDDAVHFHQTLKNAADAFDSQWYARFKTWCDEYFYLPHRQETRGVGGIFFDYLGVAKSALSGPVLGRSPQALDQAVRPEQAWAFTQGVGNAFLDAYVPIAERRRDEEYGEYEREFQLLRRGRYVEFNLLYDRGTQFGLHTDGRVESILVSMPPLASWSYCPTYDAGTREAALNEFLVPRDWLRLDG